MKNKEEYIEIKLNGFDYDNELIPIEDIKGYINKCEELGCKHICLSWSSLPFGDIFATIQGVKYEEEKN